MNTRIPPMVNLCQTFPLLSLLLIVTFPFAVRGRAQQSPAAEARFSREATATTDAQRERIKQELAGGDLPDWAGEYYEGDGLGANINLTLAPGSGFVATWHGCVGLYDQNYGSLDAGDGKIRLRFTYQNDPDHIGFPEELIPVRWSARHYLVASNKMIDFANAVNGASEPRNAPHGLFLLKHGDESKPVSGLPELPAPYASYILKQPIRTTIVSIGSSRVVGDDTMASRHTQIVLNAGEAEGVKEGMEFHVYGSGGGFASSKITKTEEHTSEADLEQDEFPKLPKPPVPAVGWKLSTAFEK